MASTPGGDAVTGPPLLSTPSLRDDVAGAAIDAYLGGSGDLERFARSRSSVEPPASALRGSASAQHGTASPCRRDSTALRWWNRPTARDAAMRGASRCLSCDLLAWEVQVDAALCKDLPVTARTPALWAFYALGRIQRPGAIGSYVAEKMDNCIGCLRCIYICPDFAIRVNRAARCPPRLAGKALAYRGHFRITRNGP